MDVDSRRLDRIEAKLDQVAEALQSLARTEEKILAMNGRLNVIEKKMETGYADHIKLMEAAKDQHMTSMLIDRITLRLDAMEDLVNQINIRSVQTDKTASTFERAAWVLFSAFVGAAIYYLKQ